MSWMELGASRLTRVAHCCQTAPLQPNILLYFSGLSQHNYSWIHQRHQSRWIPPANLPLTKPRIQQLDPQTSKSFHPVRPSRVSYLPCTPPSLLICSGQACLSSFCYLCFDDANITSCSGPYAYQKTQLLLPGLPLIEMQPTELQPMQVYSVQLEPAEIQLLQAVWMVLFIKRKRFTTFYHPHTCCSRLHVFDIFFLRLWYHVSIIYFWIDSLFSTIAHAHTSVTTASANNRTNGVYSTRVFPVNSLVFLPSLLPFLSQL